MDGGDGKAIQLSGVNNSDVSSGEDLNASITTDSVVVAEASTQEGTSTVGLNLDVAAVDAADGAADARRPVDAVHGQVALDGRDCWRLHQLHLVAQ